VVSVWTFGEFASLISDDGAFDELRLSESDSYNSNIYYQLYTEDILSLRYPCTVLFHVYISNIAVHL
jgi:hypothetical protein